MPRPNRRHRLLRDLRAVLGIDALNRVREALMLGRAHPSIAVIELATCAEFDVRLIDMRSKRRGQGVALARQVAMYLAREKTPYSLPQIGRCFDRDHTTVIHAVQRIEKLTAADPAFAAKVRDCAGRL